MPVDAMNPVLLAMLPVVMSLLSACSGGGYSGGGGSDAPVVVSMNANLSASEPIANYTAEYQAIYNAGARGAQTAAPWSSLETGTNVYNLAMIDNTNPYFGLNALAGYGYTSILVNIPIVAISARTMPSDIAGLPFNNATVKSRYHALIDQVVPYLNSSVKYVALGNEVDTYFIAHGSELAQYKELIEDARTYIHTLKPNIKVGVTTTFDGATSTQTANVASLNANMDVIILTYYPTDPPNFTVRAPATVSTDMAAMINISGGKPLVLQEWGYPSSTILSSTEQMQADFITNTFTAWKQYGSSRIPFISFFKRRDWDAAQCTALSGQASTGTFYQFLCSLGLLNNIGTPKLAYSAFTTELAKIGP
jgi:hypothetical protein